MATPVEISDMMIFFDVSSLGESQFDGTDGAGAQGTVPRQQYLYLP